MHERMREFRDGSHDPTMFMTIMIWVCIVPFVVLFTLPFFGWQGSLTAAVITFVVALIACWGICSFPKSAVDDSSRKSQ